MTLAQLRKLNRERLQLRMRMEQAMLRLVQLGPRPTLELLLEIGEAHGCLEDVADRLQRYSGMSPEMVRAIGADRIIPWRPHLVASR